MNDSNTAKPMSAAQHLLVRQLADFAREVQKGFQAEGRSLTTDQAMEKAIRFHRDSVETLRKLAPDLLGE